MVAIHPTQDTSFLQEAIDRTALLIVFIGLYCLFSDTICILFKDNCSVFIICFVCQIESCPSLFDILVFFHKSKESLLNTNSTGAQRGAFKEKRKENKMVDPMMGILTMFREMLVHRRGKRNYTNLT